MFNRLSQQDGTVLNAYASNARELGYLKQLVMDLNGDRDSKIAAVGTSTLHIHHWID